MRQTLILAPLGRVIREGSLDRPFEIGSSRGCEGYNLSRGREVGGGRGIRTPGTLPGTVVFKTTAIDHSAIPPRRNLAGIRAFSLGSSEIAPMCHRKCNDWDATPRRGTPNALNCALERRMAQLGLHDDAGPPVISHAAVRNLHGSPLGEHITAGIEKPTIRAIDQFSTES